MVTELWLKVEVGLETLLVYVLTVFEVTIAQQDHVSVGVKMKVPKGVSV